MFERRLKIFLGILIAVTVLLLARSAQVQILQADQWARNATEALKRFQDLPTTRGEILDCKGRRLAYDQACMDAAVDFRAIERNKTWMKQQAIARLLARSAPAYRQADSDTRQAMIADELTRLNADIDNMWRVLAVEGGKTIEEMAQLQATIRRRVDIRRRQVWYARYNQAVRRHADREPDPWYSQWLLSGEPAPQLDSFAIEVAEQTEPHVILPNISVEAYNRLKKHLEDYPGLVIRPSTHRFYPYGSVACFVLGHLSTVSADDLKNDPYDDDELREYRPNDLVGASGVEALCEQTLRGVRGRIERISGHDEPLSAQDPQPGRDVRLTIDIELQAEIEEAFKHVVWKDEKTGEILEAHEMHGAVVVLDPATNEVRALVSYPTYDLNHFDEIYHDLATDSYNQPLLNRATQMAIVPGSTVKPMVGLGAVTQGVIRTTDTIECTGYMYHNGHRLTILGRCWTASMYGDRGIDVSHHQIPWEDPHPNGFLTLADAIQRSCNVYFETLGERLTVDGLSYWFSQFGLGRPTGIGLPEVRGTLPRSNVYTTAWFGGIGQGEVLATPIQMANAVATIARDGIWMRARIIDEADRGPRPSSQPSARPDTPDRVDLHLAKEGLAAVKEGMWRVVNTFAGSGKRMHRDHIAISGKTGTAQTGPLLVPKLDADGKPLRDPVTHRIEREDAPVISNKEHPNPDLPWYRGSGSSHEDLAHAWFICFAPAKKPTVAFSVVLEYGGSGGGDAAPVANAVLDALIKHGYLPSEK